MRAGKTTAIALPDWALVRLRRLQVDHNRIDDCAEMKSQPTRVIVRADALDPKLDLLCTQMQRVVAVAEEPSLYASLRASNLRAQALLLPEDDDAAWRRALDGKAAALTATQFVVGTNRWMRSICNLVERVAPSTVSVLIEGESGTGKEDLASIIRSQSTLASAPYVAVNCAAIPPQLLESEFFGHVRGAFTDAKKDRRGLFEAATGGTLFLDEVGELGLDFQAKLLRALETGEVRRVGASTPKTFDVRIIAATNRQLEREVDAGRFRKDLYYRINQFSFRMPTLAERRDDIAALTRFFLDIFADINPRVVGIEDAAMRELAEYDFPGNIRELKNLVRRLKIVADAPVIRRENLPSFVRAKRRQTVQEAMVPDLSNGFSHALADYERMLLEHYVRQSNGRAELAAYAAGIPVPTLYRKLRRHKLTHELKHSRGQPAR